jgi:hypothetical protein
MDGKTIELRRFPNSYTRTVLDYVRFEKLTPTEAHEWREREGKAPCIPLSGLNDIPDIAWFTDSRDPDPGTYAANLWEHANAGVRKVFWRVDGQCSDFPSKVNTMRYVCARVHGVFSPQAKSYGRVLRKVNMLELAVKAARRYGLQLYGWMRFNSYMGNVQSDFFKQHPEYHEESESGYPIRKVCLAHDAVRKHKIAILCDAAGYGLDGVNLGFLRHPPVLSYAPILVGGFRRQYGELPPRDRKAADPHHLTSLPESDEPNLRWLRYRAGFLTQFGRELREALKKKGLGRVKIAIWVRPNHCLFDGIDMEAWLNEGLCDEVVADAIVGDYYQHQDCYAVRPEWKKMVQSKVPLTHGIPCGNIAVARRMAAEILKDGYDGICTYESDCTVLQDQYIQLYHSLRKY